MKYFHMKNLRIFLLLLSVLLALTSCGQDVPAMAETESDTAAVTDSVETEPTQTQPAETEPKEPKKRVAITFDDGPAFDNDSVQRLTYKIVDEFRKYGGNLNTNPDASKTEIHERAVVCVIPASTPSEFKLSSWPVLPANSRTNNSNVAKSFTFKIWRTSRSR